MTKVWVVLRLLAFTFIHEHLVTFVSATIWYKCMRSYNLVNV